MSRSRRRHKPPKAITPLTAQDANKAPREAARTSSDKVTLAHLKDNLERFRRTVRRRRIAAHPEHQEA